MRQVAYKTDGIKKNTANQKNDGAVNRYSAILNLFAPLRGGRLDFSQAILGTLMRSLLRKRCDVVGVPCHPNLVVPSRLFVVEIAAVVLRDDVNAPPVL